MNRTRRDPDVIEFPKVPVVITREALAVLEEHRIGDGWLANSPAPISVPGAFGQPEGAGLWLIWLAPETLGKLNALDVNPSKALLKLHRGGSR